jgi:hypothetical protein
VFNQNFKYSSKSNEISQSTLLVIPTLRRALLNVQSKFTIFKQTVWPWYESFHILQKQTFYRLHYLFEIMSVLNDMNGLNDESIRKFQIWNSSSSTSNKILNIQTMFMNPVTNSLVHPMYEIYHFHVQLKTNETNYELFI